MPVTLHWAELFAKYIISCDAAVRTGRLYKDKRHKNLKIKNGLKNAGGVVALTKLPGYKGQEHTCHLQINS